MLIDNEIKIIVSSSKIIYKLKAIGIESKMGDEIILPIDKLWIGSNMIVNVKCDICGSEKKLQFNLYNKNIKKHNIYCCCNKCSYIKNKLTSLNKYGIYNYNNSKKATNTKIEKYGEEYARKQYEKSKKTKELRYGDVNYNNIEKAFSTNLKKYNTKFTFDVIEFKEKSKKTNLERYGVEDSRSSELVKNKRKKTNFDRYGVESFMSTEEFKLKSKKTSIEKYGVDSPNKSDIVKQKKINNMIKKYGFISNSMTEESKRKLVETNLERYGVEYPMQVLEFAEKQLKNAKKIIRYNDNLYYQGSYEKHFLDYLNNKGLIDIIKRGPCIKYDFEGKERIHYPDFYIDEYNLIIEIKSSYYYYKYLHKNISKFKKCIELGYNYLFIINKNYKLFDVILDFSLPL